MKYCLETQIPQIFPKKGWEPGTTDPLAALKINIIPNPTHGIIIISISGESDRVFTAKDNSVSVWDIQGRLVFSNTIQLRYNKIDLSAYPDGMYPMKITIGGMVKEYKIIKE